MGQIALGFRSLLVKLAIFFVLASLLAWALGGTLWPRPEIVDYDGVSEGSQTFFWRLRAGGKERGTAAWQLMVNEAGTEPRPADERIWADAAGPVRSPDGTVYFAGRSAGTAGWLIQPAAGGEAVSVPDRLAVERQFARLGVGLELQSAPTIARQRPVVLDPPGEATDDGDSGGHTHVPSPPAPPDAP